MRRGILLGLVLTMAMFVCADLKAFAGQSGDAPSIKHSVTIVQSATLGGQTVEQGKYEAEITGGAEATLVLRRDKQEVARVRVRRTELPAPAKYDRVDLRVRPSGKEVIAVYFKGERGSFEVVDDEGVAIAEKP